MHPKRTFPAKPDRWGHLHSLHPLPLLYLSNTSEPSYTVQSNLDAQWNSAEARTPWRRTCLGRHPHQNQYIREEPVRNASGRCQHAVSIKWPIDTN